MPNFEIRTRNQPEYTFTLRADNGETMLFSEIYVSKQAVESGIAAVILNSMYDARFERRRTGRGRHYFVLKASTGRIVGRSQEYRSRQAMESGIAAVKKAAVAAGTRDLA
jgi:uncharacterized protein